MTQRAVYKNAAVEFLDDLFSGSKEEIATAFDDALALLDAHEGASLSLTTAQLADEGRLPDGIGTADDFDAYWLADTSRLAGQDVDRVMRYGYREAIRLARSHDEPLPIETLWITGAGDDFEVHICEGRTHVTVVLFIPLDRRYGSERARARSWAVRVGGLRDGDVEALDDADPPIVKVQLSGPRAQAG